MQGTRSQEDNRQGGGQKGGEPFSDLNNDRELGYWNCGSKDHWKYKCPKLTAEEQTEQPREGGPILLKISSVDDDIYAAKDKYDGIAFGLPAMVQRLRLNPHYLYLDS